MTKDPGLYLQHIHGCILRIEKYVQEGRLAFFQDCKTQDAVIRNLEVIGQAVKDLGTEQLISEQPTVPWPQIAGLRNVLAHQYLGVDLVLVWNIVEQDIPVLKSAISTIAVRSQMSL